MRTPAPEEAQRGGDSARWSSGGAGPEDMQRVAVRAAADRHRELHDAEGLGPVLSAAQALEGPPRGRARDAEAPRERIEPQWLEPLGLIGER